MGRKEEARWILEELVKMRGEKEEAEKEEAKRNKVGSNGKEEKREGRGNAKSKCCR